MTFWKKPPAPKNDEEARDQRYAASSWARKATAAAAQAGVSNPPRGQITITCTNREHPEVVSFTRPRDTTADCPSCGRTG